VSECWWKFINWFVELISSCEMNECGWKVINWLIEPISSCEVSECGGRLSTGLLNSPPVVKCVSVGGVYQLWC
jgi:hypothetical protein